MDSPKKSTQKLSESLNPQGAISFLELQTLNQTDDLDTPPRDRASTDFLLPSKHIIQPLSFYQRMADFFGIYREENERIVYLDGKKRSSRHVKNLVRNQKYNVFTIIPLVLYNQFKYFFNLFYLLIALSQFFEPLKVGYLFTYIGPLGLVLSLTLVKEGFDDFKRFKRDKEANSALYKVLKPGGKVVKSSSGNLRVGDIIEVTPSQRIPADLILLYSSEASGSTFLKTDQLDGETDWKLRRAVRHTQEFFSQEGFDIAKLEDCSISFKGPSENIYQFEGVYEASSESGVAEPLFLDHTLWTDTKITSGRAFGIVLYTGKETRIVMNSRQPRSKAGKLEVELNFISKILFVLMMVIALFIMILRGFHGTWFMYYFRYVLLICSIIPISLRVNLDFAKVVFSDKINKDQSIPGAITRNSTIPEELGRIAYLLTDKTGTLTKNEMYFKKLVLENAQYESENLNQITKIIKAQYEKASSTQSTQNTNLLQIDNLKTLEQAFRKNTVRKDKDRALKDFAIAVSVCHNVTPIVENGISTFHASSPDEIALVKFAQDFKMKLISRTNEEIVIENPTGRKETFKILANFPFSSETKRMGILVKNETTNQVTFFLKGADVVISPRVREVFRAFLLDECEALARTGLRTMVFAQRHINEDEYTKWKAVWNEANLSLINRDEKMRAAANLLETNMDFVGITGVEDLLQDDINVTIESLRNAGIKIWMLTGDKVETAKCIAISTGLKGLHDSIFEIKEVKDDLDLNNKLNQFSNKWNTVLLIDGVSLTKALENSRQLFFQAAVKAPAVICSRCLPTQKAIVTEMVKTFSKQRVACIGDGGNDVGMIQAADVGIGLVGKEGQQASLASDFSITEFKHLKTLILWHGRLYYKNSAKMSQFVIHRGLIISFIQAIFCLFFYFVAIPIYNGMLMVGYTSIYTMFPVFALIYDEDIDRQNAFNYPILYKSLQKSRELNIKTFLLWVWKSIFQAVVIMTMAVYFFPDTFLKIVTITFTALILSEILNVYTELHKLHPVMVVSLIGTVIVYFLTMVFLKSVIDVDAIDFNFMVNIVMIVCVSWLPLHIIKVILKCVDPSDYEKIMRRI